ncbi:aminotransferase class I/II-fold pyridoxal phosphate-dependent enzyme [Rhodopila sp.]|uniref:aminotransferase class I/II-fold pyridoxal phosphate-dependent enzyme n=1 Tax=Rhodopila sp. TaxID=2480087 RepID=UPI003D0CFD6A
MSGLFGLSDSVKTQLLTRLATRRAPDPSTAAEAPAEGRTAPALGHAPVIAELNLLQRAAEKLGLETPYFREHAGIAGATTRIGNREYDNFASYNYLDLNGDPRVTEAAKAAIDRYGTSVSASRLVSGERPLHRALETELAAIYGAEDCLTFVSGHATNVTVLGHLVDREDVILHDALSHNSIVQGALLAGARRIAFPHNDLDELERLLAAARPRARRALLVVEGHYSMDGDVPDLARLVTIARRWRASLMVDEAHSLGVLGRHGLGIAEHAEVDPGQVDVWMGTLSKTLCGSGGYIAGSRALIDYLRHSVPGFVYSVGLSPPVAAAALAALRLMREEPWRVERLQANGRCFLEAARAAGLATGNSIGAAIVPVMVGSSIRAARLAQALFKAGVNVQPIIYPAVPEQGARLRFFVSSRHDEAVLRRVAAATAAELRQVAHEKLDLAALAAMLARD